MRISEHFSLGLEQPSLDFVNVDTTDDSAIFVDPRAIRLLTDEWGDECVYLVQDFFGKVLELIRDGKDQEALEVLKVLKEPNETHLGLSAGKSRGRALGTDSAEEVWKALKASKAVKSGLLEDLEDTLLMIDGIGPDIVSDITTNIIRPKLIEYTQEMCQFHGIGTSEVSSGPIWVPKSGWKAELVQLPVLDHKRLLLVPKAIVRIHMDYDVDEYFRHYLLEHLQGVELSANSALVELLKNGRRRVTKKSLKEKYGTGKKVVEQQTLQHPEVLDEYRQVKDHAPQLPLSHEQMAEATVTSPPDWDKLLADLADVSPGKEGFHAYEKAISAVLQALFYPTLDYPRKQTKMHNGMKIIDLMFRNMARHGFFWWLMQHNYIVPNIIVECKNYNRDPANPELDQLIGRFSPQRGRVGLLVCRKIEKKDLFDARCRETAKDQQGYIVALDDDDIRTLVEEIRNNPANQEFTVIQQKFQKLLS